MGKLKDAMIDPPEDMYTFLEQERKYNESRISGKTLEIVKSMRGRELSEDAMRALNQLDWHKRNPE